MSPTATMRPCVCPEGGTYVVLILRTSVGRGWAYATVRCESCLRATPQVKGRTGHLAQVSAVDAWDRGWIEGGV